MAGSTKERPHNPTGKTGDPAKIAESVRSAAVRRREQRHEQLATLAGLGIVLPPGIPAQAIEILTASAFLSRREIESELGVSRKRIDTVLDGYCAFRDKILANRDALVNGLLRSIVYVVGKQTRDALLSGKVRPRSVRDCVELMSIARSAAATATEQPTDRPPAPSAHRAKAVAALGALKPAV